MITHLAEASESEWNEKTVDKDSVNNCMEKKYLVCEFMEVICFPLFVCVCMETSKPFKCW